MTYHLRLLLYSVVSSLMCYVGSGGLYDVKTCAGQNYTSCVTVTTTYNTSYVDMDKKCGFSQEYLNKSTDTLDKLFEVIEREAFFKLENDCKYENTTNITVCRCLLDNCNSALSTKSFKTIYFVMLMIPLWHFY